MDWEELMDLIVLGEVERITARHGSAAVKTESRQQQGADRSHRRPRETILTLPRGFYLKKNFTAALLARHFLLQHD